jgi:predicted 2-oxoglutarate/Fe(II)-dependent dioxygenase YbiX
MANKQYVKSLRLKPHSSCYCGSNKEFGACCGSSAIDRNPPVMLSVVSDFLPAAQRNPLLRFANKQQRKWLTTIDIAKSTAEKNVQKRDPGRVTQAVNMTKRDPQLQALFRKALLEQVAPAWQARPAMFEPPYVLRYPPGGKYVLHSDGDEFDREAQRWYGLRDRDVSLLIYLNDDYVGGGLRFDHLNYTYQPKAGDLVFFPSNHLFSHQSLPIEKGTKWAVVCWSCFPKTSPPAPGMTNWNTLVV